MGSCWERADYSTLSVAAMHSHSILVIVQQRAAGLITKSSRSRLPRPFWASGRRAQKRASRLQIFRNPSETSPSAPRHSPYGGCAQDQPRNPNFDRVLLILVSRCVDSFFKIFSHTEYFRLVIVPTCPSTSAGQ